jgi:DNA repair protein RecO (recombination protein O)
MTESLNAILLRRSRFSDTSLIVSWLTDNRGRLKTIAKGALRPKSPLAGKLDLFFHCDMLLSLSHRTDLHVLREVSVRATFDQIRVDFLKTSMASYFVELIEQVTESDHPVHDIYRLLLRAFNYLNTKKPEPRGLLFFESELCKCLGLHAPDSHSAAEAIVSTFGHLPRSRADLLTGLQRSQISGNF